MFLFGFLYIGAAFSPKVGGTGSHCDPFNGPCSCSVRNYNQTKYISLEWHLKCSTTRMMWGEGERARSVRDKWLILQAADRKSNDKLTRGKRAFGFIFIADDIFLMNF